jgi:hypothetical protein
MGNVQHAKWRFGPFVEGTHGERFVVAQCQLQFTLRCLLIIDEAQFRKLDFDIDIGFCGYLLDVSRFGDQVLACSGYASCSQELVEWEL